MHFYVLIDYENVSEAVDFILNTEQEDVKVKLTFFIGPCQITPDMSYRNKLLDSFGKENVDFIQVHDKGNNALDFVLSGFLGLYAGRDPSGSYWIVSKDQGFDPLIAHFKGELKLNVQRALNIRDLVNIVPSIIKLDNNHEKKYFQEYDQDSFRYNQLIKTYSNNLFLFLRKNNTNLPYWKRSCQEIEKDLVKSIPNYWEEHPQLKCEIEKLPNIISAALERLMKHKFITEDNDGKLCYFVKDDLLIEPAIHYVLEHKPINKQRLLNILVDFGKICMQDDLELFSERMLKELQEKKVCWIIGESISYTSEEDAMKLSLKYSFFKLMPSKLKENPPPKMSLLKEKLRSEGKSYSINDDDINEFISQLIYKKNLSFKDDDLTWSFYIKKPMSIGNSAFIRQSMPIGNTTISNYQWTKTLYYITLANRPTTLDKLRAFLFNNFKTSEEHINAILQKLQNDGYFNIKISPTGEPVLYYREPASKI